MKDELRKIIMNYGADVCGFASVDRFDSAPKGFHPCDIYYECKTVIVFGVAIPKGLYMVEPRLIYSHFNSLVFPQVDNIALKSAKLLEIKYKGLGVPIPCDGPYEYWDEEKFEGRGLISMNYAAINAGIGTLGKNTLLLNKTFGNRLVIGSVLTNLEIESDSYAENICLEKL
jgi:epoxyqueuosine reductase QueG